MMEIYEPWDTTPPQVLARSQLYNLPPIGVGTPEVESLTSYIARLSQAHCLSPYTLLSKVILTSEDSFGIDKGGLHLSVARVLNGIGTRPQILVKNLERLTADPNIRLTTMVTFAGVLSHQHLIRPKRAWCPVCFAEWLSKDNPLYEPLLWAITAVTVCPQHHQQLSFNCPQCNHEQPPLSSDMHPGYCQKCQAWLGEPIDGLSSDLLVEADLKRQVWIAETVGELLATTAHLVVPPSRERFIEKLSICIDLAAWGSVYNFSHNVGLWHVQLRRLLKGYSLPTMSVLVRLGWELDVSLVALLTDEKNIEIPGAKDTRESLCRQRAKQRAGWRTERMSLAEVQREMDDALNENPPPSGKTLMCRTGRQRPFLQQNFPALYARILERYREFHRSGNMTNEEAEVILRAALKENPPPSLQSVFRRMGFRSTGYRYYECFSKLCRAIAARYKKHRTKSFDIEKVQQLLEASLMEEPVPSFSRIARRLNYGRGFIRKTYPELSATITARYQAWLSASRKESKDALLREVESAIYSLRAEGLRVSENRIRSRVSRQGNSLVFKQIVRQVIAKME